MSATVKVWRRLSQTVFFFLGCSCCLPNTSDFDHYTTLPLWQKYFFYAEIYSHFPYWKSYPVHPNTKTFNPAESVFFSLSLMRGLDKFSSSLEIGTRNEWWCCGTGRKQNFKNKTYHSHSTTVLCSFLHYFWFVVCLNFITDIESGLVWEIFFGVTAAAFHGLYEKCIWHLIELPRHSSAS